MLALPSSVAVSVAVAEPSFRELEGSLTCQCGCGLTVQTCNHLQCPSAIPLRQEIRSEMALGKTKEVILDHFAEKYGEKILSSPTTTGFNLTAWVMPFLIVGLGTLFVLFTLLRWRKRTDLPSPTNTGATPPSGADMSEHKKTLERELENFES